MCCALVLQDAWEVVCIDAFLPDDRRRRYDVIHGGVQIGLPFDTLRLYVHFGGHIPDVHFVCKLPERLMASVEGTSSTHVASVIQGFPEALKVYDEVRKLSRPKAHAQMARALERRWSVVTKLSPVIARGILRDVAGYELLGFDPRPARKNQRLLVNSDTDTNVDTRLAALLDTNDPSIILDGRTLVNDAREGHSKFDAFWEAVEKVMVSSEAAVVDERRHNQSASDTAGSIVLQRSANVSFRDIHQRAARMLNENDPVPSVRWMEYQLWPKDASLSAAVNYTGRFKVTMAAQSAQLRKTHPDQMVGHVEFKYLRTLAVRKRLITDMICGDDKHKARASSIRNSLEVSLGYPCCCELTQARQSRHANSCRSMSVKWAFRSVLPSKLAKLLLGLRRSCARLITTSRGSTSSLRLAL